MAAGLLSPAKPAQATNGYFAHGYGTPSKSMAGTGVTIGEGPLATAQNPALGNQVGNVAGGCLTVFMPHRDVTVSDNGRMSVLPPGKYDSQNEIFGIACGGANFKVRDDTSVGALLFANGGMNTKYDKALFANFGAGTAPTGVDMAQAFLALNLAHRVSDTVTIGAAPVFAIQRFKATGLEAFAGMSQHPGDVTGNGYDYSYGGGLKIGAVWTATPWLTLGASYQSKMWMTPYDKYRGLFAEGGDFDIPAWASAGIAVEPVRGLTFLLEYQRIFYSDVAAIANGGAPPFGPLGSGNGPGFGWKDMDVFKLGVQWQATSDLMLRAGYSHASRFTDSDQVLFNILAPATVRDHVSAGFTYALSVDWRVSASYTHAFSNKLTGSTPGLMMGQRATLRMDQDEATVSVSYRF
ncbi:MAG TPA: outer membrane protein transport protein [Azospirillum sp.]